MRIILILREAELIKKLIGWSPNAKAKLKRISLAQGISTGTVKRGMIYGLARKTHGFLVDLLI